jgi:hypothetical protein
MSIDENRKFTRELSSVRDRDQGKVASDRVATPGAYVGTAGEPAPRKTRADQRPFFWRPLRAA